MAGIKLYLGLGFLGTTYKSDTVATRSCLEGKGRPGPVTQSSANLCPHTLTRQCLIVCHLLRDKTLGMFDEVSSVVSVKAVLIIHFHSVIFLHSCTNHFS